MGKMLWEGESIWNTSGLVAFLVGRKLGASSFVTRPKKESMNVNSNKFADGLVGS